MSQRSKHVQLVGSTNGAKLRTSKYNGTDYIVVPVVAMVGDSIVWPINAEKPEFVPAEVLSIAPEQWNNRPVVMGHPHDGEKYIPANDPETLEKWSYGHTFGSKFKDNNLTFEAWLDPVRAARVNSEASNTITRLQEGETVEVSIGAYVIVEEEEGEFQGQKYGARWLIAVSDHLATLPQGTIGACNVEMGCGCGLFKAHINNKAASRNQCQSTGSAMQTALASPPNAVETLYHGAINPVNASPSSLRVFALSQARRPKFTGTETGQWTAPSLSDYVRYLFEGAEGPTSVSQMSSQLKIDIANHTLLGDPEASNFRDLALFPCVNPSNGKLNEKALRAVLGGRGAQADIPETALESARDMSRRLLNSEFGLKLETANMADSIKSLFTRALESLGLKASASPPDGPSNIDLEGMLWEALRAVVPAFDGVSGVFQQSRTVIYSSTPGGWSDRHWWSRTYDLSEDGKSITLNDDVDEVAPNTSWQKIGDGSAVGDDDTAENGNGLEVAESHDECQCHKLKDKGEEMAASNRAEIVANLIKSGKFTEKDTKALEAMSDETLEKLSQETEMVAEKETKETQKAVEQSPEVSVSSSRKKTEDEWLNDAPGDIRYIVQEHRKKEAARRADLIGKLTTASKFTEEKLKTMETDVLETMALSLVIDEAPIRDFSARSPVTSLEGVNAPKLPNTWNLKAN